MKSLTPILIIIICIGAYFMYISPQIQEVNNLRAKLAEYKNTLGQARELKTTLDSVTSAYESIPQEDIAKLNNVIPEKADNSLLANYMNSVAIKDSVAIKNFTFSKAAQNSEEGVAESPSKSYNTLNFSITASGSFDQFIKFMNDLESSMRLFDIRSITMSQPQVQVKGLSATYQYLVEIDTYYLTK